MPFHKRFILFTAALIAAVSLGLPNTHAAGQSPNILIITVDNLGYGDLPCYNPSSPIKAPRLDRLAREGARLTSFYTASSTCTVSRACLLTGRIPQRHGLVNQLPGLTGNYGIGLNHKERLIPQFLKRAATEWGHIADWLARTRLRQHRLLQPQLRRQT